MTEVGTPLDDPSGSTRPFGGGVHITRGVTPRIPIGGLVSRFGVGGPSAEGRIELQLDTCVHWLDVALEHLDAAKAANVALIAAEDNGTDWDPLLDREFKSSMQAIVADATFFDALSAATKERTPKPPTSTSMR